ncbi:MAG: hypothetical protein HY537_07900 [Deltaproteobacteria bacterium]|nr:hypothetical protein [Deltaproteobacteria bacterium]
MTSMSMRALWFVAILFALATPLPAQGMVRLYSVVDRFDATVGSGCEKSWDDFQHYLNNISEGHRPHNFDIFQWKSQGNVVVPNPDKILNHFRSAQFNPTDILWFYYCGHGETAPGKGHILKMSTGDLARADLRIAMEGRGTQGVIITTDACSTAGSYIDESPVGSGAPTTTSIDHWKVFSSLLWGTVGTVDITAASGLGRAFVDPSRKSGGANFTDALRSAFSWNFNTLDLDQDGRLTWSEMFIVIREQTRLNFQSMSQKFAQIAGSELRPGDDKDQIPFAFSLGRDPVKFQLYQRFDMTGNERGVRFFIKSRFEPALRGRTVTFALTFWDSRGVQIPPQPGVPFTPYLSKILDGDLLAGNDNNPLQIFMSDQAMPTDGRLGPIRVLLTIWDRTDNSKIYERAFPMITFGFGPRPPATPLN